MDPLEYVNHYIDVAADWYKHGDFTISQMYFSLAAFLLGVLPLIVVFLERRRDSSSTVDDLAIPPPTEIVALYTYPIKSCRGIKLNGAKLEKSGLELDRQWMFVDAVEHKFLTIRQNSKMTLITTAIDGDDNLVISVKGTNVEMRIPAHPTDEWLQENTKLVPCKIWGADTDGYEYDPKLMKGFSDFFGQEVRLLRKGPSPRLLVGNGATEHLGREESVRFPDLMPVLIASESSIAELNSRLVADGEKEISIERFRPNIIVKGHAPWSEDNWKTVRVIFPSSSEGVDGEKTKWLTLDVVAHCARCQVPNVDPETAVKHKTEPWKTLVSYRRIDEGIKFKPCFGMLCAPRHEGVLKVGMKLLVTELTKDHKYIAGM